MSFSEKLRTLLDNRNMKAVDLARQTGLSEAAISDYLKGKKEPRGRQSIEIARALRVSLDELWETDFAEIEKEASQLNLSQDASEKLKELRHMASILSEEEWKKLKEYADLLESAQRNKRVD